MKKLICAFLVLGFSLIPLENGWYTPQFNRLEAYSDFGHHYSKRERDMILRQQNRQWAERSMQWRQILMSDPIYVAELKKLKGL